MQSLIETLVAKPELASAVAAVASALTSLFAFVVSAAALVVARSTLKHQRRHDILSVKPLPSISLGDYQNCLFVKVANHGAGPMVINNIIVTGPGGDSPSLIDRMPLIPMNWTTFIHDASDRAVLPGDSITLLKLSGDPGDTEFSQARDAVRGALASLSLAVSYSDIYGTKNAPKTRDLKWFGRLLEDEYHADHRLNAGQET